MRSIRRSWISGLACSVIAMSASGQTVQVSMTLDDADGIVLRGQTTTLHLFAEVIGGQPGNGIYGYALNLLETNAPIIQLKSVTQYGDPLSFAMGPGTILNTGLRDVFAGDGGFFINPNRGIGSPYELLSLDLTAEELGTVTILADRATNAFFLGAPDGFLLQAPGRVNVDFGTGVTIHVVPEPGTLFLLGVLSVGLLVGRREWNRIPGHRSRHM